MTGKHARQSKSRWQFAVGVTSAALICLISGWVVFHRFMTTTIPSPSIDSLASPSSDLLAAGQPSPVPSTKIVPTPIAVPQTGEATDKQSPEKPATGKAAIRQGVFRVGNPTSYPVRVALLSKKMVETGKTQAVESSYERPAHWDFAPEEGGAQGLLVSLPDRTLKLKQGDVVVAFAQDGSGRYWGPYVVNETALPTWNAKAIEWQLILQP